MQMLLHVQNKLQFNILQALRRKESGWKSGVFCTTKDCKVSAECLATYESTLMAEILEALMCRQEQ